MVKNDELMEILTFRGNRDLWITFCAEARRRRERRWDALKPYIKDYIKGKIKQ